MNYDLWTKKPVWRKFLSASHKNDGKVNFIVDNQPLLMVITPVPYEDGSKNARYQFRIEGHFSHLANFGNSPTTDRLMEAIPHLYANVTYDQAEELIALLLLQV